jgi:hypothetical protein
LPGRGPGTIHRSSDSVSVKSAAAKKSYRAVPAKAGALAFSESVSRQTLKRVLRYGFSPSSQSACFRSADRPFSALARWKMRPYGPGSLQDKTNEQVGQGRQMWRISKDRLPVQTKVIFPTQVSISTSPAGF